MTATATATEPLIPTASLRRFRDDGFTSVGDLIPRDEALAARAAAEAFSERPAGDAVLSAGGVFRQLVNVWRHDPVLRALTFHPRLRQAARELGGRPMRLWHDQLLIKPPRNGLATEFHQDLPYWPVARDTVTVSAWIALGDVVEEGGCMAYIPGSHRLKGGASDLGDHESLTGMYPQLAYAERTSFPLRAGGSTFHQGYTAHRALANATDTARVAHIVIFIDAAARFDGKPHCVTDGRGLRAGDGFPEDLFPLV